MKWSFIKLIPLIFILLSAYVYAQEQITIEFTEGSQIKEVVFSKTEVEQLAFLLKNSNRPDPIYLRQINEDLPEDLKNKLIKIGENYLDSTLSQSAQDLASHQSLTTYEIKLARELLMRSFSEDLLVDLEKDSSLQIRLLSRDMDDFYYYFLNYVNNTSLSEISKKMVLDRVKTAKLSRAIAENIGSNYNNLNYILKISDEEFESSSSIRLIDIGFDGSIVDVTKNIFANHKYSNKFEWVFIWKSRDAPKIIKPYDLNKFNSLLKDAGLSNFLERSNQTSYEDDSLRVGGIEHLPKWNKGTSGKLRSSPTLIMLDLDDTILKEVDINKYGEHENVQTITYRPSKKVVSKYKSRLKNPVEKGKIIHYRFIDETTMESTVVIRPIIEDLLKELRPMIKANLVRLLITSSNDPLRTASVYDQIIISGKSLKDWGAELVELSEFASDGGKDMRKLKSSLSISSNSIVIALDDIDNQFNLSSDLDRVVKISPWNQAFSEAFLEDANSYNDKIIQEQSIIRYFLNLVYEQAIEVKGNAREEVRLQKLAESFWLSHNQSSDIKESLPARKNIGEKDIYEYSLQEYIIKIKKEVEQVLEIQDVQEVRGELEKVVKDIINKLKNKNISNDELDGLFSDVIDRYLMLDRVDAKEALLLFRQLIGLSKMKSTADSFALSLKNKLSTINKNEWLSYRKTLYELSTIGKSEQAKNLLNTMDHLSALGKNNGDLMGSIVSSSLIIDSKKPISDPLLLAQILAKGLDNEHWSGLDLNYSILAIDNLLKLQNKTDVEFDDRIFKEISSTYKYEDNEYIRMVASYLLIKNKILTSEKILVSFIKDLKKLSSSPEANQEVIKLLIKQSKGMELCKKLFSENF